MGFLGLTDAERQRARDADMAGLQRALKKGARPFAFADIKDDPNLPPYGFFRGDLACLAQPTLAVVGTRNASTYGRAVSQKFAEVVAHSGVTVLSGGAHGIDGAAHRGALDAGGATVAVLITGVERAYPLDHRGMFEEIAATGCLISQFAVGAAPGKFRPLVRNLTVAALSDAVLVVEAPLKSGSLNTANSAVEIGKPLFVVPATIDLEGFRGSHGLIRDGATLIDHPDHILQHLNVLKLVASSPETAFSEVQARIMDVLELVPLAAERIAERAGLEPAEALSELTMLELEGFILRDFGGFAKRPL